MELLRNDRVGHSMPDLELRCREFLAGYVDVDASPPAECGALVLWLVTDPELDLLLRMSKPVAVVRVGRGWCGRWRGVVRFAFRC